MQTQDRTEDVLRDPTFLAEQEMIMRGTVDRLMPGNHMRTTSRPSRMGLTAEMDPRGAEEVPYYEDLGISLYTDAVHTDTYRGTSIAHVSCLRALPFLVCFAAPAEAIFISTLGARKTQNEMSSAIAKWCLFAGCC